MHQGQALPLQLLLHAESGGRGSGRPGHGHRAEHVLLIVVREGRVLPGDGRRGLARRRRAT
eukprot:835368-Pyramimonas_sp.AAC.1